MTSDFITTYYVISLIYTIFSITALVLRREEYVDPLGLGIVSVFVAVFVGWLLFPFLLLYNIFVKKSLI